MGEVGAQGGVMGVVGGQRDVETGREEKGACHGEEVEDAGSRGARVCSRYYYYSVPLSP